MIQSPPSRSILEQANDAINGERAQAYGDAKQGFSNVGDQWALYVYQKYGITVQFTPEDVCWMMADLKKIRQMNSPKRDNVMDAAGYIGLIEQVTVLK